MPPKQKRQIRKPPRPPKPSTPDLDVFAFYQDFVSKERPGLSRIYSDEDLKELAVVGAKLIRTLSEDGCGSEDARLLSLLVLYDVSIFIDGPKAAGGGGDEELLSGVVETLELLTKVIDLSNPGHRFATIEFSNRSLFDKYREQCPLSCGNFNGCVEYPRSCGIFCGWVYSLTGYPTGYSPGLFKRPLLRITVIGHVCSNTRNYIEGIIDVGLDLWRADGHEDCLVLQFGYIGNDKKPIDLFRTLNTFSERSVGCMLEGDRLEDITGRKWELLRKLLVGAVMPSNRYLDHRLATDFNYNESYVVHTTHKRNPKSAGLGSSLVKTRWTHVREIGDGAFGTVTLQRSDKKEQPRLRAVKFIHRCDEQFKEVKALCRVMDRNDLFVAFLGWYKDKNSNGVHIAMEYIKHGDLSWWLQDGEVVDEATTREITIQVLTGLEVLHSRHICHRDLKPQNILIASLNPLKVKIADFGASKDTSQTALKTRIGTDGYLAPELLGLIKDVKNPGTYTFVRHLVIRMSHLSDADLRGTFYHPRYNRYNFDDV